MSNSGYTPRTRGIRIQTIRRDRIPVEMVNGDTGESFAFEIRSTGEMSARDRKLIQNYIEALSDFEQTPDAELDPSDYDRAESIMEDAARIGTRGLDLGAFNALSTADRFTVCMALASSFSDERDTRNDTLEQMRVVRHGEDESRPNLFQRLKGTTAMKTSHSSPRSSAPPTEVDSPTG